MPEAQHKALKHPYHKDRFSYDQDSDSYICPQGQRLRHVVVYRCACIVAHAVDVRPSGCVKDRRHGRLEIGPHEVVPTGSGCPRKKKYKRRQHLVEPVFGIMIPAPGRAKVAAVDRWRPPSTCVPSGAHGALGQGLKGLV